MIRFEGAFLRAAFSAIPVTENSSSLRSPMPTTPYTWMRSAAIWLGNDDIRVFSEIARLIIYPRQPQLCCTSTSGENRANGSWPTSLRAHHRQGQLPAGEALGAARAGPEPEIGVRRELGQRMFELELKIEMAR
jgi:hypothetical protein